MTILESARPPWPGRMLSVLRIVTGLVFFSAGTMKVFGFPPSPVPIPPFDPMTQFGVAGLLETIGGPAIMLGLFTRPVAFVLAGEMAVAYFQVHAPMSPFPTISNGIPPILFCFIYLYLAAAGGGAWSVDRLIAGRRT